MQYQSIRLSTPSITSLPNPNLNELWLWLLYPRRLLRCPCLCCCLCWRCLCCLECELEFEFELELELELALGLYGEVWEGDLPPPKQARLIAARTTNKQTCMCACSKKTKKKRKCNTKYKFVSKVVSKHQLVFATTPTPHHTTEARTR